MRIAGMLSRLTLAVCQKSVPDTKEIFSFRFSWDRMSSTSHVAPLASVIFVRDL